MNEDNKYLNFDELQEAISQMKEDATRKEKQLADEFKVLHSLEEYTIMKEKRLAQEVSQLHKMEEEATRREKRLDQEFSELQKMEDDVAIKERLLRDEFTDLHKMEELAEEVKSHPEILNRKRNEAITPEIRSLILKNIDNGMTPRNAAKMFSVSKTSVYKIMKRRGTEEESTTGADKKGKEEAVSLTTPQASQRIERIDFHPKGSKKYLDSGNTAREHEPIPQDSSRPSAQTDSQESGPKTFRRPIYYIAETGFQLSRKHGHSEELFGARYSLGARQINERFNVMIALGREGIIQTKTRVTYRKQSAGKDNSHPGLPADQFLSFVTDLVKIIPRNSILVMAGSLERHSKIFKEETWNRLSKEYGFVWTFVPPFSPYLDPAEYVFGAVQENLQREEFSSFHAMRDAVLAELAKVSQQDASGYFDRVEKLLGQARAGIPIATDEASNQKPIQVPPTN